MIDIDDNDAARYYRSGFAHVNIDVNSLNSVIERCTNVGSNDEFTWSTKYDGTQDFRPNVIGFDDCFIDVLFDANIPEVIARCTATDDMTLFHCQLRRVVDHVGSYMPWHRDTHIEHSAAGRRWAGCTPPVHKLILYPDPHALANPRLDVVVGSHRMMFDAPDMDVEVLGRIGAHSVTLRASGTSGILFNTSLLHSVRPDAPGEHSMRIIYAFATRRQYRELYSNIDVHRLAHEKYEKRRHRHE
jgi:hypothetical protein